MEIHTNKHKYQQQSWLQCLGQLTNKNNIPLTQPIKYPQNSIFLESPFLAQNFNFINVHKQSQTSINQLQSQEQFTLKRSKPQQKFTNQNITTQTINKKQQEPNQQQFDSSKQSSLQGQKVSKWGKQNIYSKNYRQKKKEQMKILQEQNTYLKQKINDLQRRLRQKQIQLNRLKRPIPQKQFGVQQLNQQFKKITNLLLANDPIGNSKTIVTPQDKIYNAFINSYDEVGFGGTRKKQILKYYFNEFLETIMKDSQKYLFLICNKTNNSQEIVGLESYQQINFIFQQIMQINEQKKQRIKYFSKHLHSYMSQIKNICCQIYNNFNKINFLLDRVHNFMKSSYLSNMDFGRKRISLQNWFYQNKHSKLMRRLRSDWFQYLKQCAQKQQEQKTSIKGKKNKKKVISQTFKLKLNVLVICSHYLNKYVLISHLFIIQSYV